MLKTNKEVQVGTSGGVDAFLGNNTKFEGTLVFDGLVRIDGEFLGKIQTEDILVVAEKGNVKAEINAGIIKISGHFEGTLNAKNKVELYRPAVVEGIIRTPSLRIEEGVIFNGKTEMTGAGGSYSSSSTDATDANVINIKEKQKS